MVRPGYPLFRWHHSARRILGIRGSPASHTVLASFLRRYGDDSTLTTSYLDCLHAFFYGAPNSLPNVLFPLFSRVEDYSIYPTEHFIGVPGDTVCWTMDDGEE
jgi:hypothetical protein